jgi:REP-associated tyrosine transposase
VARRPRLFAPGVLYHVIARGNQRQKTFLDDGDYQAYMERLGRYRKRWGVIVYAYCLMPNHVHLLVEAGSQPLSRFMQGLQQSYTQYFNRKRRKIGHLFHGRYQAIVCDKDQYLLTLLRYIHHNPVRTKIVRKIDDYRYSGHRAYAEGWVTEVVEPQMVLEMLGGRGGYRRFVRDGLREGHREEYYRVEDQRFLGGEGFGEKLKRKAEEEEIAGPKKPLGVVFRNVARGVKVAPEVLGGADRSWEVSRARALVGYALIRRLGYKVKDVARCLGRDMATVSSLVSRFAERMADDGNLRKLAARLTKDCLD